MEHELLDPDSEETAIQIVTKRGDSFDIGEAAGPPPLNSDQHIINLIQNPDKLASILDIDEVQAANIRAVLAALGSGASVKMLEKHLGTPLAGGIGGFLAGILASKVIKKEKK